jgi:hypothetical protein
LPAGAQQAAGAAQAGALGAGAHGAGLGASVVADVSENSSKILGESSVSAAGPSAPKVHNGRHTTRGAASASFLSSPCVIFFYSVVLWTVIRRNWNAAMRFAPHRDEPDNE